MKKLTSFLREWGIIIQIALCITWFLWATQLGGVFNEGFRESLEYQRTRNAGEEERVNRELTAMADKFSKEAKALGRDYTAEKYYEHLRALYTKGAESSQTTGECYGYRGLYTTAPRLKITPGAQHTSEIEHVLWQNLQSGTVSRKKVDTEAEKFIAWEGNTFSNNADNEKILPTLSEFKSWCLSFYLKTMLLLAISYITKMACRKGILETILAGKTKFVMSIILWPAFFYKYPNNVIREIRVQAELRRLGKLFRKLSPKEIGLVREIANGSNYHSWLGQKRRYNRGLALALTVTVIVNLLPSIALGSVILNDLEAVTQQAHADGQIDDDVGENIETTMPAIIENPDILEPPVLIASVELIEFHWESVELEGIDCIPEVLLFVKSILTKLLNQIAKEINYEEFNYNHYYNNRINPVHLNLCL